MITKKHIDNFKLGCRLLSIGWASIETILCLQYIWWRAYFYGLNTGDYVAMVNINSFGEAHIEMIFWVIITPLIIYGSYLNIIPIISDYNKSLREQYGQT